MESFSGKLLEEASAAAYTMLEQGEERMPLNVGEQKNALWISLHSEEIIGTKQFEIQGKTIYVGLLRNEEK